MFYVENNQCLLKLLEFDNNVFCFILGFCFIEIVLQGADILKKLCLVQCGSVDQAI